MIKYRARFKEIEKVEVIRETSKFIFYIDDDRNEIRNKKHTDWYDWFDTWEDAHSSLVKQAQINIDVLSKKLEIANELFIKVQEMKND